jgi:polysaccharide pyruvyl transferase WcaK-like protein
VTISVGLLSPCGWGNLGDAAIMAATIEQIRARQLNSRVIAFTLNPADTEQRHHIEAFPIDALALAGFSVDRAGLKGVRRFVQRVLQRVRTVSCRLANVFCWLLNVVSLPIREVWHWWRSYRVVRRCGSLVVCGGGQLDEFWGGPWGHPYVLFKFALLSRMSGTRLIVLSSGSAKLTTRLGRWFVKHALRIAEYRSFREHFAVNLARELGAPEPNVWCPDLAFALFINAEKPARRVDGPIVGISPIAWLDPRSWPEKDSRRYGQYFSRMFDFVSALLARRTQVVLFATAAADHAIIADLVQALREESASDCDELVRVSSARTVPDLLNVLANVDVVIASRLHAVILSYACRLPVVAVSYDPKVDQLVELFNQQDACLPIESLEGDRLLATFDQVCTGREKISRQLAQRVAEFQELLADQYNALFGPIVTDDTHVLTGVETSILQAEPIG